MFRDNRQIEGLKPHEISIPTIAMINAYRLCRDVITRSEIRGNVLSIIPLITIERNDNGRKANRDKADEESNRFYDTCNNIRYISVKYDVCVKCLLLPIMLISPGFMGTRKATEIS